MWDIATKSLLLSVVCPTFVTAVAVDPLEMRLFMGSGNGPIYEVGGFCGATARTRTTCRRTNVPPCVRPTCMLLPWLLPMPTPATLALASAAKTYVRVVCPTTAGRSRTETALLVLFCVSIGIASIYRPLQRCDEFGSGRGWRLVGVRVGGWHCTCVGLCVAAAAARVR